MAWALHRFCDSPAVGLWTNYLPSLCFSISLTGLVAEVSPLRAVRSECERWRVAQTVSIAIAVCGQTPEDPGLHHESCLQPWVMGGDQLPLLSALLCVIFLTQRAVRPSKVGLCTSLFANTVHLLPSGRSAGQPANKNLRAFPFLSTGLGAEAENYE